MSVYMSVPIPLLVSVVWLTGCVDVALPPELMPARDARDPGSSQTLPDASAVGGSPVPPPDAPPVMKIASLTVHDMPRAPGWSIQQDFQIGTAGAHPWSDYPNTYVIGLDPGAEFLIGNEWVRVAANSKLYVGGPQATLSVAVPADIYLVVDDRWGPTPLWVMDWMDTGINIQIWESSSRPMLQFSLFKKHVFTGDVTLPPIGSSTAYDYFIIVD
jgi:hypothetical protein